MPRARLKHATQAEPKGKLASRTLAMSTDTNPMGHIFGGWIMANMDAAGKMTATEHAGGRAVTVAVSRIVFMAPVAVGDTVCCYIDVIRGGRTSLTLPVEVWVMRQGLSGACGAHASVDPTWRRPPNHRANPTARWVLVRRSPSPPRCRAASHRRHYRLAPR